MRAAAQVAVRLALEHHPLCGEFAGDRLRMGRWAVCSGCAAAIPASLAGLAGGLWLLLGEAHSAWAVFAAGFILGVPQGTTYLHRGGRRWRFAVKALGGLGIGFVAASALFLPVSRLWLAGGTLGLLAAFAGLQAIRLRSILSTCDACPFRRDWDACPGFNAVPAPTAASQTVPVSPLAP